MITAAMPRLLDALRTNGSRISSNGRAADCPAHDDNLLALQISATAHQAFLHCTGGCSMDSVLASLRLTREDLEGEPVDEGSQNYPQGEAPPVDEFQQSVLDELQKLRIRKAAREALNAEGEPVAPPFDFGTLAQILARPAEPPMRVDRLIPWEASTLVVAQRKTGKTTLMLNYAESLLTGEPFLGAFEVRPLTGTVAILNFEVSAAQLARWAEEIGVDRDALLLVNLRGRRNPLGNVKDRAELAKLLRDAEVESLIVDPFGRAYTGTSQNDSGEVGSFLVDLEVFARGEVGVRDLMLTAHAGWNGERTRGSSALEDWADSIITLTRDAEDETLRFLRATGRDVEVEEDRLDFEPVHRTLTMSGTGSRKKSKEEHKIVDLVDFTVRAAVEQPGIGMGAMIVAIREMDDAPTFQDRDVSKAAKRAVGLGMLRVEGGGNGKKTSHYPTASNRVQAASTDALLPNQTTSNRVYKDAVVVGGSSNTEQIPTLDGVVSVLELGLPTTAPPEIACLTCPSPLSKLRAYYGHVQCAPCEAAAS